jgi:aspartate aminotransferase
MAASTPTSTVPATRRISARIGGIAESATMAVDAKAKALKAAGRPVIGFGAGEPDFPTPAAVVAAAEAACADQRNHRYTPAAGLPELREAIAAKTLRDSRLEIAPSQVLVTNGGKQAVYQAFATLIDPGDEVLLPTPYWTTYPEAIALAGGVTVPVVCGPEADYLPSVEQLEEARTERTKVLLWCSPSNPTGAVASRELTEAVGRWAVEHGIWVITDEIYEHLVYDGAEAVSMPVGVPELADTCLIVNGVAKTYAMTGWRVGYAVAHPATAGLVTKVLEHEASSVMTPAQHAAVAALAGPQTRVGEMREAYRERRDLAVRALREEGLYSTTPRGAFYAMADISRATPDGTAFARDLAARPDGVACAPGDSFGPNGAGLLRISLAAAPEAIETGIRRIGEAVRAC